MIEGMLLVLVASIFQGSVGLGLKKYKPFSWEAFWFLFVLVSAGIIPHVWMWIEVPRYMTYILQAPVPILLSAILCGAFWGVSSLMFGKAIEKIGIALVYGINMGIGASLGSLVGFLIIGNLPEKNAFLVFLLSMLVMLIGVGVIIKAGICRDQESQVMAHEDTKQTGAGFVIGLVIALIAGIGSGALNIGFIYSDAIVKLALQDGIAPQSASVLGWMPVLIGGIIPQLLYTMYLMIKNKTYTDYKKAPPKAYGKALLTSVIWFCALTFYAKATVMLGNFGAALGWVAYTAIALVVSNYLAIKVGEWDGHTTSKKLLIRGNLLLIVAFVLVGISNCI